MSLQKALKSEFIPSLFGPENHGANAVRSCSLISAMVRGQ